MDARFYKPLREHTTTCLKMAPNYWELYAYLGTTTLNMFVPKLFPSKLQHQDKMLNSTFSLLIWNIHKENQEPTFKETLKTVLEKCPSDFLLFQEVKHPKKAAFTFEDYSYALASNIETAQNLFGVTTAAKVQFHSINCSLSNNRELRGLATHKSLLITEHHFSNGTNIYIVNLHAINFVSLKSFTLELAKIEQILQTYSGPMIIGGDFNNWSERRVKVLKNFQKELHLKKATINQPHHIKTIFSKPLDHIFYRGISLIKAEAINTKKVSDHNPIHATFKVNE